MEEKSSGQIYQLMGAIMRDIGAVGKDKRNKDQGFNFRGVDDVYNALHGAMAAVGVFTTSEVLKDETSERATKSGSIMQVRRILIRYRFNAPDGSSIFSDVIGEGMDTADKATNKAFSAAHKYLLLQGFLIATEDLTDGDSETPEQVKALEPSPDLGSISKDRVEKAGPTPKFSEVLKDYAEAGLITDVERTEFFGRGSKIYQAASAVGKAPDFSALIKELNRLADSRKQPASPASPPDVEPDTIY